MPVSRNVYKLEVEEEDCCNPSVDSVVGVQSRVVDHPFDVLRIHFDDELLDSNSVQLHGFESVEESIQLQLSLRVARFSVVECDRPKLTRISFLVISKLQEDVSDSVGTRVDSEDDRSVRLIVKWTQCWRVQDGLFQLVKRLKLFWSDLKRFILASELDEQPSDESVAFDKDAEDATGP